MAKYTFHYFNGQGRGELTRLLFAAAEVEYEDKRYEFADWNDELKAWTPLNQLPVLEYGDAKYGQSMAIARFVAAELNLMGKCNKQKFKVDMILETLRGDIFHKIIDIIYCKDGDEKKKELTEALKKKLPSLMKALDGWVDGKFFCGDDFTAADIALLDTMTMLDKHVPDAEKPAKIVEIVNNVKDIKGVKKWIETRPIGIF